jgi:hypothetical protein
VLWDTALTARAMANPRYFKLIPNKILPHEKFIIIGEAILLEPRERDLADEYLRDEFTFCQDVKRKALRSLSAFNACSNSCLSLEVSLPLKDFVRVVDIFNKHNVPRRTAH